MLRLMTNRTPESRGRVGYPIDPAFLHVTNEIRTDTSLGAPPVAIGEGRQEYRLFCNQGDWRQNFQLGLLRLEARAGDAEDSEEIRFLQVSCDGGSASRTTDAYGPQRAAFRLEGVMRCRGDMPVYGELFSGVYDYSDDPEGLLIEGTDLKETVRIQSGEMEVSAGGRTASRAFPWSSWMSEWNILRKVGRFPFGADPEDAFCLLEGLTVPKPDAFFTYMGRHDAPDFGGELHVFSMLGRGIVPFDFWLDEEHRLLACISGGLGRAYIPEALMLTEMMHDFVATEFNRERNV